MVESHVDQKISHKQKKSVQRHAHTFTHLTNLDHVTLGMKLTAAQQTNAGHYIPNNNEICPTSRDDFSCDRR
jgi:hypothetical protein